MPGSHIPFIPTGETNHSIAQLSPAASSVQPSNVSCSTWYFRSCTKWYKDLAQRRVGLKRRMQCSCALEHHLFSCLGKMETFSPNFVHLWSSHACSSCAPVKKSVFLCKKPKKASRMLSMEPDWQISEVQPKERDPLERQKEPIESLNMAKPNYRPNEHDSFPPRFMVPHLLVRPLF